MALPKSNAPKRCRWTCKQCRPYSNLGAVWSGFALFAQTLDHYGKPLLLTMHIHAWILCNEKWKLFHKNIIKRQTLSGFLNNGELCPSYGTINILFEWQHKRFWARWNILLSAANSTQNICLNHSSPLLWTRASPQPHCRHESFYRGTTLTPDQPSYYQIPAQGNTSSHLSPPVSEYKNRL